MKYKFIIFLVEEKHSFAFETDAEPPMVGDEIVIDRVLNENDYLLYGNKNYLVKSIVHEFVRTPPYLICIEAIATK